MIGDVVDLLACPVCGAELELSAPVLMCPSGHSFDIARQGYVSLLGGPAKFSGDTADMLAARARFLDAGHFDLVAATAAQALAAGAVLEVGAGTGHYLAAALNVLTGSVGIGVDIAKPAARRIARCHPRAAGVVADAWQPLPVRTGAVANVLTVFAPRNGDELHRVLDPDGVLVVVAPTSRHLCELVDPLQMVRVDERKPARISDALSGRFERTERTLVEYDMTLTHTDIDDVVAMGPSAFHSTPAERAARIAALPDDMDVTASVYVSTYRPLSD